MTIKIFRKQKALICYASKTQINFLDVDHIIMICQDYSR